jgi:peptidyl-prolyl cis-trans isomerase D
MGDIMFETLRFNLKHNRKNVMKNATAWALFGAIILVFIFWGLTPRGSQSGLAEGSVAAVVNGQAIPRARLNEMMERMRRDPRFEQFESMGGDAGRQILQQSALRQVVDLELMKQATQNAHVAASDSSVAEFIKSIPQFQQEGRFQRTLYTGYLDRIGKTPAEFEEDIRAEQSLHQLQDLFTGSFQPLPAELAKQKTLQDIKANVEFVSVPSEDLVIAESIPKTEVASYLSEGANLSKVKASYEARKAEFNEPERVKARHILVKFGKGPDADKTALAKINDLKGKVTAGNFAELARANSDDTGSKEKGGDLGTFSHGRMVPEFEKVAFATPAGTISAPVKTQYGYHLILVEEKKPAHDRTFDEVKDEIAQTTIAKERSHKAIETLEGLLKNGDLAGVNHFVEQNKLKWVESGTFTLDSENIPKLGNNEEAAQTAFALTPEKPLATRLVRQGPTAYVLRYKSVAAEKVDKKMSAEAMEKKQLEKSPEMMASMIAGRRSEDALRHWIESLRKDAKITLNTGIASQQSAPSDD